MAVPIHSKYTDCVYISKAVLEADGIINLPKLKTHGLEIFTGAIKNLYGCVPGLRKAEYHKLIPNPNDFGQFLGEIFLALKNKIRFTLIDGILAMEGNGPSSGDIRKLDVITASVDAHALDLAVTHLLGFKSEKIETIRYLSKQKAGESVFENIEILGNNPCDFDLKNFKFPTNWYANLVPRFIAKLLGKLLWVRPVIIEEKCTGCLMCYNSCPAKAIEKTDSKPKVIPSECINCLCCHEMCPSDAIGFKSSFLAKLVIEKK
jgi:Pyruvate/2-oxoacid:ferredoxin oxidoreductase delta subunit